MASHFRILQITDIRHETADCVSIAFSVPAELREEFRFTQGQNITVRHKIGDQELRRSYSICSSPLDNELRIAVKRVPDGQFSTFANDRLQPGDTLEVLPPTGKFYTELNPAQRKRYLAFAAGSGITPILSLIRTTLLVEPDSHFTLIYGNRHRPSIIFREELESLKNRYMHRFSLHHILSREIMDSPLNQGRIDAAKCNELSGRLIDPSGADEIFLCGPAEMIFTLKEWLEQHGVDRKKIHFELFHTQDTPQSAKKSAITTGSSANTAATSDLSGQTESSLPDNRGDVNPIPATVSPVSHVSIKLDGVSIDFNLAYEGNSILDAALLEGADLPYACKGGVCCTCRARLVEGQVEMDLNYALEEDEIAAGFILTCQSHPRSEKVVIDFDDR